MKILQILPSLASRDAIGVHTLNLDTALRARGIDTQIYYLNASDDVANRGLAVSQLDRDDAQRVMLYHASIGSPIAETVQASAGVVGIDYHNITPARLVEQWAPGLGYEVTLGREQLSQLAQRAAFGLADSEFNRRELVDLGYRETETAPLLIDMRHSDQHCDEERLSTLNANKVGASMLFVGKVSPHKATHDLIAMLAAYRQLYDPHATLTLVGAPISERYRDALVSFIDDLGLGDAITMTGSLPGPALEAEWRAADLFVCASDHEGFCVPLVEAMGHELPIVAYAAAAVPETIGEAGLLISDKAPFAFAAAAHRVLSEQGLRDYLRNQARSRVAQLDLLLSTDLFVERLVKHSQAALERA